MNDAVIGILRDGERSVVARFTIFDALRFGQRPTAADAGSARVRTQTLSPELYPMKVVMARAARRTFIGN